MSKTGIIYGVNGPVIYLKGNTGFQMSEMVYVGDEKLVGEVIGLNKERTTVQVFEETSGLHPGETVTATGDAISVTLGPGILHNIFDGIERPLDGIAKASGIYITRGMSMTSLLFWPGTDSGYDGTRSGEDGSFGYAGTRCLPVRNPWRACERNRR